MVRAPVPVPEAATSSGKCSLLGDTRSQWTSSSQKVMKGFSFAVKLVLKTYYLTTHFIALIFN